MPEAVALLWVHFGPYHLARLRELRKLCDVTAIEFSTSQVINGWQTRTSDEVISLADSKNGRIWSPLAFMRLWTVLEETRPRVLFIPGYSQPLAIAAALWGKLHQCRNVLMSDSTEADARRSRWREQLKSRLIRTLFSHAFVSGERAARYLRSLTGDRVHTVTGYDVVDNAYFASRSAAIHAGKAHKQRNDNFLYVGRLVSAKNPLLLISAYAIYKSRGGQKDLEIVGHGPLEAELKSAARNEAVADSVHFAGYQPYDSLPAWYANARCLILPSESEPWGLVVNEAMASGLPVIVSDRCGCTEDLVEEGRNGYVFNASSKDSLAERMLSIDALTAESFNTMSRRSEEIVSRWTTATWTEACLHLATQG